MDKHYADTVRLLLNIAPDVFDNNIFAMKGGTAINLFPRDMPRLSVDIDVVYLPWQTPRDEALQTINQELAAIAQRVERLGVQTRLVRSKDLGDTKMIAENEMSQVKVEVNVVFRGTVTALKTCWHGLVRTHGARHDCDAHGAGGFRWQRPLHRGWRIPVK